MSRWEPDARDRLIASAMELYAERGYNQTTISEIAARAGLTSRTFFRHFADKREVVFGRTEMFREHLLGAAANAPDSSSPREVVTLGLLSAAGLLQKRKGQARQRYTVIRENAELQERELSKSATLATELAGVLKTRGVDDSLAIIVSQAAMAVFSSTVDRWMKLGQKQELSRMVEQSLSELSALLANR